MSLSGSVLGTGNLADAVTTPIRDWDAPSNAEIPTWTEASQELIVTAH
ncbi:hypothetical protein [Pendulispora rubella]